MFDGDGYDSDDCDDDGCDDWYVSVCYGYRWQTLISTWPSLRFFPGFLGLPLC